MRKTKWDVWDNGKAIYETRICVCGCGKELRCKTNSRQRFIHGHNTVVDKKVLLNLQKGGAWNKGKKEIRREVLKNQSISHIGKNKGAKCNFWRGGITPEIKKIRHSIEYRLWRESVFARDNWTCQDCGLRGDYLEAHHIKSFKDFIDLRFAIDNGVALCKKCHDKTKRGALR